MHNKSKPYLTEYRRWGFENWLKSAAGIDAFDTDYLMHSPVSPSVNRPQQPHFPLDNQQERQTERFVSQVTPLLPYSRNHKGNFDGHYAL